MKAKFGAKIKTVKSRTEIDSFGALDRNFKKAAFIFEINAFEFVWLQSLI